MLYKYKEMFTVYTEIYTKSKIQMQHYSFLKEKVHIFTAWL
jgi:hypothetical protein